MSVYSIFQQSLQKKQIALLIDPDKCDTENMEKRLKIAGQAGFDYIFVGGSLITNNHFESCIRRIKNLSSIPLVIFPGNNLQLSSDADAILFLSLISGRNPEHLIGSQVIAAPVIRKMQLEAISTGYMLIESGKVTAAQYMSGTLPIPNDKPEIAKSTAMAGEMLGLKAIYMDAGSGALHPIPEKMISEVKKNISIPLIIGGGIRNSQQAAAAAKAGADILVIGNAAEQNPEIIIEIKNSFVNQY